MSNWKNDIIKDKDSKWSGGDLSKTPSYYIGRIFGYEASHIIEDFELSYNIGSVCSYILRAGSKKSKAMSDIDKQIDDYYKAVAHLKMEIDRLNRFKGLRDEI